METETFEKALKLHQEIERLKSISEMLEKKKHNLFNPSRVFIGSPGSDKDFVEIYEGEIIEEVSIYTYNLVNRKINKLEIEFKEL